MTFVLPGRSNCDFLQHFGQICIQEQKVIASPRHEKQSFSQLIFIIPCRRNSIFSDAGEPC